MPCVGTTECGGKPADVVFVLDRSNSVYVMDFLAQLKVLQDIVRILDIAPDKTQVRSRLVHSGSVTNMLERWLWLG